jgi:hypothetical protein
VKVEAAGFFNKREREREREREENHVPWQMEQN